VDATPSFPHQDNEGEGNKTAAREYNEAQRLFVQSGAVEEKAQEAARAMSSPERVELERAEEIGKRRAEPTSAQMLAQRAQQQTARGGEYLAGNVQEYPLQALFIAGLIGYAIGYLVHTSWSGEPQQPTSASMGHSGDVLRPLDGHA